MNRNTKYILLNILSFVLTLTSVLGTLCGLLNIFKSVYAIILFLWGVLSIISLYYVNKKIDKMKIEIDRGKIDRDRDKDRDKEPYYKDCIVMLLARVMKADGSVSSEEMAIAENIIRKRCYDYEKQKQLSNLKILLETEQKYSIEEICSPINRVYNIVDRQNLIFDLLEVVYADDYFQGTKKYGEALVLGLIATHLHLTQYDYNSTYSEFIKKHRKEKTDNKTGCEDNNNNNEDYTTREDEKESYFKKCILVLLASMMKADGSLMKCELDMVKGTIRRYYKTEFGQKDALEYFKQILDKEEPDMVPVYHEINSKLEYFGKSELIMELLAVAYADENFNAIEQSAMWNIIQNLKITDLEYKSIKALFMNKYRRGYYNNRYSNQSEKNTHYKENQKQDNSHNKKQQKSKYISDKEKNAYTILGIDANVSDAEVKKAYRAMAVKFHPDNAANLGDEAIRQATETMKQINEAWETVKMTRGIK